MELKQVKVEVLPCPFCGLSELNVGVQSVMSYGVRCPQCRVAMAEGTPDEWPKGVRKKGASADDNFHRLALWCLRRAVARWNSRSAAADRDVKTECEGYV